MKKESLFKEMLPIFSPRHAFRKYNLSKDDFRKIQENTSRHLSFISFTGSLVFIVLGIFLTVFAFNDGWGEGKNNLYTYLGLISLLSGSTLATILIGINLFSAHETPSLTVIGDLLFHLSIALTILFFYVSDLKNNELSMTNSVSPSLLFVPILMLCQPGRWQSAISFNGAFFLGYLALVIYGAAVYQIVAVTEQIIFALGYLLACYCTYSAYTYVECQRFYIETKNSELLSRSTHDPLTGARNRNGLRLYLEDHLENWKRNEENVLLIMSDIDDFKLYNDSFGHLKGDRVLQELVKTLENTENLHHFHVFRYGGEEFLMVLPNVEKENVHPIMEILRKRIESLKIEAPSGAPYPFLTISLGGAYWKVKQDYLFHDHVQDADMALYEAKSGRKNKCILHDKSGE